MAPYTSFQIDLSPSKTLHKKSYAHTGFTKLEETLVLRPAKSVIRVVSTQRPQPIRVVKQ